MRIATFLICVLVLPFASAAQTKVPDGLTQVTYRKVMEVDFRKDYITEVESGVD
jgi:hypothetical protein